MDKKETERDRSPNSDYFDRGRDVTRYPVDPNAPPIRASTLPLRCNFYLLNIFEVIYSVSKVIKCSKLTATFLFSGHPIQLQLYLTEQMTVKL